MRIIVSQSLIIITISMVFACAPKFPTGVVQFSRVSAPKSEIPSPVAGRKALHDLEVICLYVVLSYGPSLWAVAGDRNIKESIRTEQKGLCKRSRLSNFVKVDLSEECARSRAMRSLENQDLVGIVRVLWEAAQK